MKLRPNKPKNATLKLANEQNMKGSYNEGIVDEWVGNEVREQVEKGKTAEEIADNMSKRGALKTETDKKILEGHLRKSGARQDPSLYKERQRQEFIEKSRVNQITNEIIRQSQ